MNFPLFGRKTRTIPQHHTDETCFPDNAGYCNCPQAEASVEDCDIICSDLHTSRLHKPVIDLDLPCRLVESATPDHFHLYIDRAIEWSKYVGVLKAMAEAGLVEWGYHDVSVERGYTAVRHPDKPKVIA